MTLPDWFLASQRAFARADPAEVGAGLHPRVRWLRRALGSLSRSWTLLLDERGLAARPGLLQAIDPRAKVLGLGAVILSVSIAPTVWAPLMACSLAGALAILSRVPPSRLAPALMAALFAGLIVLPVTLNLFAPGEPLLALWPPGAAGARDPAVALTKEGVLLALRFILRVAACTTLALLLAATSGTARLFRGLRTLWVPRLAVMTLDLMVRYLEILLRAASELHLARISRTIGDVGSRADRRWVSAGVGALYRRTRIMAEQSYMGMIARGYTGEPTAEREGRMKPGDWLFMAAMWASALAIQLPR